MLLKINNSSIKWNFIFSFLFLKTTDVSFFYRFNVDVLLKHVDANKYIISFELFWTVSDKKYK